jgi:uncharacterized membrane protein
MSSELRDSAGNGDNGTDGNGARAAQTWPLFWLLPLLASFAYGAWLYGRLPAQVPVHWNFSGEVDRYGGPFEASFLLPLLLLALGGLMLGFQLKAFPPTAEYDGTRRVFAQLTGIVLCFMLYVQVVAGQMFQGTKVHFLSLLTLGCGVMFILMGNLLPKLRRNWIAGARLPWVMQDDVAWVKTQRVAGLSFVALGIALVLISPLPGYLPLALVLAGKLVVVAGVIWYSLSVSKKG